MEFQSQTPAAWVDMHAVCARFGVSVPTIHRWIRAGMPCHQAVPKGRRYFDLLDVDAWLKSRSTSPAPGQVA